MSGDPDGPHVVGDTSYEPMTGAYETWPHVVSTGAPVVHVEGAALGPARPGWPAGLVVTGFAFCLQGLARLSLFVDGEHEATPFSGLHRPDLEEVLGSGGAVTAGFRGEVLGLDGPLEGRELVALAVAPDGRAAAWRVMLPMAAPPPPAEPRAVALQPPPRERGPGASLAGRPPRGRRAQRRWAEEWAERALRLEGEREAAQTDRAWAGLQTRLALEHAAEAELARRAASALRDGSPAPIAFADVEQPRVSVVVTAHDGAAQTARCLRALARSGDRVPYEVVVVDDGEDPAVARLLAGVRGATVVRNGENLGYLRSANRGALAARGEHIALLNNDTEPQPGWLDALTGRLEAADDVGVVTAKLLFPDGRLQEAGSVVYVDGSGRNRGWGEDEAAPEHNEAGDVDYGSAAALLVRGTLWRGLGGFDERFSPAYYEDVDLCFAARERGLRVVYEPAARVVHAHGGSMGPQAADVSRRLIEAHRRTFADKWSAVLAGYPATPA